MRRSPAVAKQLAPLERSVEHQAEEARADEVLHLRYRDLFDAAPDPSFLTTRSGVIQHLNLAAETLLGRPAAYIRRKPLAVFVHVEDRRRFRRALAAVQAGRTEADLALRLSSSRTTAAPVEVTAIPLPDSGDILWIAREEGSSAE